MFRFLRRRLPTIGRTPRLVAAGVCLLLAFASTVGAHAQHPGTSVSRSRPVVVVARDLPAGHRLTRGDLVVARWPAALRPPDAPAAPNSVLGRRLAGPLGAREIPTSSRLLGDGLTTGLGQGMVAAAVGLDDPHATDLVRPGDRVDLLGTPRPVDLATDQPTAPASVATVATRALVLAVLPRSADADAEVVLAVDRPTALRITRDRAAQVFAVMTDPP
jgi:Flp pilus assembly protein CpaB